MYTAALDPPLDLTALDPTTKPAAARALNMAVAAGAVHRISSATGAGAGGAKTAIGVSASQGVAFGAIKANVAGAGIAEAKVITTGTSLTKAAILGGAKSKAVVVVGTKAKGAVTLAAKAKTACTAVGVGGLQGSAAATAAQAVALITNPCFFVPVIAVALIGVAVGVRGFGVLIPCTARVDARVDARVLGLFQGSDTVRAWERAVLCA
jgi:hypothetical protein